MKLKQMLLLLELELELELLLLLEDAIRTAKPVTAAATTSAPGSSACSTAVQRCTAALASRGAVRAGWRDDAVPEDCCA